MRYREFLPSPCLSTDVECFWLLEGYDAPQTAHRERLMPDGCVELIVNLGDRFREHHEDGATTIQPVRFVAGQMTRPVFVSPVGTVRLFGIRFVPGGTIPFLDVPPAEVTNRIVALELVAGELESELSARLDPEASAAELVELADATLVERARRLRGHATPIRAAVLRILESGGQTSLDHLATDLGISGRQLERRFVSRVGLGPKTLSRILRFQQVFHAVERADTRWARVAVDCGYYDQSHLIRDFRQFSGDTPTGLLEDFSHFAEFFTRRHRASVSSKTT
jgi:AraC-like DNA-binding protein